MAAEAKFLRSKLDQLDKGLEKAVQDCLEELKESLSENLYDKFEQVVGDAVSKANDTAAKWGAPVNRENRAAGGYFWSTYKYGSRYNLPVTRVSYTNACRAICRRNGVYSNAQGPHDFNEQL